MGAYSPFLLRQKRFSDVNIANTIYDLLGKTPMIFLDRLTANLQSRIALKLEFLNPFGSVKDRLG